VIEVIKRLVWNRVALFETNHFMDFPEGAPYTSRSMYLSLSVASSRLLSFANPHLVPGGL
jgi:hypothetical protein